MANTILSNIWDFVVPFVMKSDTKYFIGQDAVDEHLESEEDTIKQFLEDPNHAIVSLIERAMWIGTDRKKLVQFHASTDYFAIKATVHELIRAGVYSLKPFVDMRTTTFVGLCKRCLRCINAHQLCNACSGYDNAQGLKDLAVVPGYVLDDSRILYVNPSFLSHLVTRHPDVRGSSDPILDPKKEQPRLSLVVLPHQVSRGIKGRYAGYFREANTDSANIKFLKSSCLRLWNTFIDQEITSLHQQIAFDENDPLLYKDARIIKAILNSETVKRSMSYIKACPDVDEFKAEQCGKNIHPQTKKHRSNAI